ncbi:MAG: hypothetical protein ABIM59_05220, partial [candidate division WOR-3 bacterium]
LRNSLTRGPSWKSNPPMRAYRPMRKSKSQESIMSRTSPFLTTGSLILLRTSLIQLYLDAHGPLNIF